MQKYTEVLASVAAVLDDPARSLIGDPRQQGYKVSLTSNDMREAMQYARKLARLGIIPSTTLEHDSSGAAVLARVNLYTVTDQRALLDAVGHMLCEARAKALEDLVAARSAIPEDLRDRIITGRKRGLTPSQIARKLNELDLIAGMGGKCWTALKVRKVLKSPPATERESQIPNA